MEFSDKFKSGPYFVGSVLKYGATIRMPADKELAFFEKYFPLYVQRMETNKNKKDSMGMIFYEFLKYVFKNKPEWAEQLKKLIPEFDERFSTLHKDTPNAIRGKLLVGDYLKAMKVEFQDNFIVDEYKIDLYIPNKNMLIKILNQSDINFDRFSLNGRAIITKRIYESFPGYKAVFVNNNEFYNLNDHMNRVNYLISNGIENQNTTGTYDFSHIKLETKEGSTEVEAPAEETAEKVEEEEAEALEEEVEEEPKKA